MRFAVAAVTFVLLAGPAASPIAAEMIEHRASGLEFDVPDGWELEEDGDLLTAVSPGEEVVVFFLVSSQGTAEAFLDGMSAELDALISNAEITTEPTQEEINGLTQIYVEGTGEHEGEGVDWDMTLVLGGRASLVVVAIGAIDGNQGALQAIYGSIRP